MSFQQILTFLNRHGIRQPPIAGECDSETGDLAGDFLPFALGCPHDRLQGGDFRIEISRFERAEFHPSRAVRLFSKKL